MQPTSRYSFSSIHPAAKAVLAISICAAIACAILAALAVKGGVLPQAFHSTPIYAALVGGSLLSLLISGVAFYLGRKKPQTAPPQKTIPSKTDLPKKFKKKPTSTSLIAKKTSIQTSLPQYTVKVFHLEPNPVVANQDLIATATKWLHPTGQSPQKRLLIEQTIEPSFKDVTFLRESVEFKKFEPTNNFEKYFQDLKKDPLPQFLKGQHIEVTNKWFNYQKAQSSDFFLNYASSAHFGGAFLTHGNVQEEHLMVQFPEMAKIAFYTNQVMDILPIQSKGDLHPPYVVPTPTLVTAAQSFDTNQLYGGKLGQLTPTKVSTLIQQKASPRVNFIAIAARCWRQGDTLEYSLVDLDYHLKTLLSACFLAKSTCPENPTIHGGKWGCGVFGNNTTVMTILQLLAAKITGVDYVLHDVNQPIYNSALKCVQENKTVEDVFKAIINMQKDHPGRWNPINQ